MGGGGYLMTEKRKNAIVKQGKSPKKAGSLNGDRQIFIKRSDGEGSQNRLRVEGKECKETT